GRGPRRGHRARAGARRAGAREDRRRPMNESRGTAPRLRIGVVGLGFMGRTHLAAWRAADSSGRANEIAAVCDRAEVIAAGGRTGRGNLEAATSTAPLFDPASTKAYEKPEDLFADAKVDAVSLCTPTPTHVDLAIAALAAGKHVLVEKPVA